MERMSRRVEKFCRYCTLPYTVPSCRVGRNKFCSSYCAKSYASMMRVLRSRFCIPCGSTFFPRRGQLVLGRGTACSKSCAARGDRNPFYGRKHSAESMARAVKTKRARGKILTGPRNPSWKGGRYVAKNGYVVIRVDGIQRHEHRVVMERHLGRPILSSEMVHHINGNKSDNRIENLEVMSRADHAKHHEADRFCALAKWAIRQTR